MFKSYITTITIELLKKKKKKIDIAYFDVPFSSNPSLMFCTISFVNLESSNAGLITLLLLDEKKSRRSFIQIDNYINLLIALCCRGLSISSLVDKKAN